MNTQDFCYWLQGYFELSQIDEGLSTEQVVVIKEHLQLVFKKETMNTAAPVKEVPVKGNMQELVDKYMREQREHFQPSPVFPTPFKTPDPYPVRQVPHKIVCSSQIKQLPDDWGVKIC